MNVALTRSCGQIMEAGEESILGLPEIIDNYTSHTWLN